MHPAVARGFALLLLVLLSAAPALAAPAATLSAARAEHAGMQESEGALAGLRLRSAIDLPATFTLDGAGVALHTVNVTASEVTSSGGVTTQRGGTDRSWAQATLSSAAARSGLDLVVLPLGGRPAPTVTLSSRSLGIAPSDADELAETAHVDSSRPVLRGPVGGTALASSAAADEVEVRGAFAVSVWSWNFTASSADGNESFPTGVSRSDVVRDPATGQIVTATVFQQVAQVWVGDGTLRLRGLSAASLSAYSPSLGVSSGGRLSLSHATGLLDAGGAGTLVGQDLVAEGTLSSRAEGNPAGGGAVRIELLSFEGTMSVAGQPVSLGSRGALHEAGGAAGGGLALPAVSWGLGLGASLALAGLAILLARGPARRARFNRIESRFDAKDYPWVLRRIEPFTAWQRYGRRASVLKAVSLLSLQDYKEAQLYLESLDPARGPDAATKAFLQACAAAGLRQDDAVLQHLGDCFRLDPSYIREAKFVPVLSGYLPYFSISPEFS